VGVAVLELVGHGVAEPDGVAVAVVVALGVPVAVAVPLAVPVAVAVPLAVAVAVVGHAVGETRAPDTVNDLLPWTMGVFVTLGDGIIATCACAITVLFGASALCIEKLPVETVPATTRMAPIASAPTLATPTAMRGSGRWK
jgi:hypothetical protein